MTLASLLRGKRQVSLVSLKYTLLTLDALDCGDPPFVTRWEKPLPVEPMDIAL